MKNRQKAQISLLCDVVNIISYKSNIYLIISKKKIEVYGRAMENYINEKKIGTFAINGDDYLGELKLRGKIPY